MIIKKDDLTKIIEIFTSLQFDETQIEKLLLHYQQYYDRIDKLAFLYEDFKQQIIKLGYKDEDARLLASSYPLSFLGLSFKKRKIQKRYLRALENIHNRNCVHRTISVDINKVDQEAVCKILYDFGFPSNFLNLRETCTSKVLFIDPEELEDNLTNYLQYFDKKRIIKLAKENSRILFCGEEYYEPLILFFQNIDVTKEEFYTLINRGAVGLVYHPEQCLEIINWFVKMKFSNKQIKKIINDVPRHLNRKFESQEDNSFQKHYDFFINYGFNDEETKIVFTGASSLFSTTIELIEKKIKILEDMNYSKEEIIYIISLYSGLLTTSEESIKNKLDMVASLNIKPVILLNPRYLIQGVELTYARYSYLTQIHNIEFITATDMRVLFIGNNNFSSRYDASNQYVKDFYENKNVLKKTQ